MPDPQRCIAAPALPAPSLPAGITYTVPGIGIAFNPKFCCKLPSGSLALPPTPIPAVVFSVLSKLLAQLMDLINSFIAGLAIRCPRL